MPLFGLSFTAMASPCEIRLAAQSEDEARALAGPAIAEVRRIETTYSRYLPDSVVSRINAAAGGAPVSIDAETESLFGYAAALHQASGGLFDITAGTLRRAWDFKRAVPPAQADVQALLPLIGWTKVERAPGSVRLPEQGMEIDFGGFAKEFAADRAAAFLAAQGVRHGYVDLGGDMRFLGPQPDGQPWQIGIRDPRDPENTMATVPVTQGALATSGDYERYFDYEGRRYCHILDPRTGQPVQGWRSVTVLAPVAVAAGSYTTIAMLMQDAALAFLDAAAVAYLAIDADGVAHRRDEAA